MSSQAAKREVKSTIAMHTDNFHPRTTTPKPLTLNTHARFTLTLARPMALTLNLALALALALALTPITRDSTRTSTS